MFKISLMDQSDLEIAYKIEKEVNPTPWSKNNFFSSLEVGHHSMVCKEGRQIVGFIIYSFVKNESHLLNISVKKKWQGRGAGKLLMDTLLKQSKALGACKIFLEVRSKNIKAIGFYKKYKFTKDAVRLNYYSGKNPDDAVLMSLNI